MTVRFTGGEPLLRKDFEELYIFARKLGLRVLLFTNATLITPRLADLFSRIPPLEKIEVTVYGIKKSSYEAITRTPGSYEAAWQGINLLLEHKVPFVVKMALLLTNKDEIDEFEAWAQTIPWMQRKPSYSMFFDLRSRRNGTKNELIRKLRIKPEEGLKILTRNRGEYLIEMRQFCSKFMKPAGNRLFSCGSGVGGGCVDAYGYFYPCLSLKHQVCAYDLKHGSLQDALMNFFPKIREMEASNPDYLSRCAQCFLKGLCEQCPAKSYTEHGTLDTPVEYLCKVAHVQARFLGLLEEWENGWEITDWKERINRFVKKERGART